MAKKTIKRNLITDSFVIVVTAKAKNPFTPDTVQFKHGAAVLACKGKTVADAKKKGADAWTVRELVRRKVIAVKAAA